MGGVAVMLLTAASCHHRIIEDSSQFALSAGQSTMLLGSSCKNELDLGYSYCPLKDSQIIPSLNIYFMNPADYVVSDCMLGIYKSGSIAEAGFIEIDLTVLGEQIKKQRLCLLKVEAIERYPDPHDRSQTRELPLAGGYFIELLNSDYFPVPEDTVTSWCYIVKGTNKGRRKIELCP